MKIQLSKSSQSETVLVAFVVNSKAGKESRSKLTHPTLNQRLKATLDGNEMPTNVSECVIYRDLQFEGYRHVLVVSVPDKPSAESLRQTAATVYSNIKSMKAPTAAIYFDGVPQGKKTLTFYKVSSKV